jgi:hypothetical protein
MRVYRLCRSSYPPYDGEGARLAGGRWNSKGSRVIYVSENRSLAVLEILVHLSDVLPDKYLLGSADLPADVFPDVLTDEELPESWATLIVGEQSATRRVGDDWLQRGDCTPRVKEGAPDEPAWVHFPEREIFF